MAKKKSENTRPRSARGQISHELFGKGQRSEGIPGGRNGGIATRNQSIPRHKDFPPEHKPPYAAPSKLVYIAPCDVDSYVNSNGLVFTIFGVAAILTVAWAVTLTYFHKVNNLQVDTRRDVAISQLASLGKPYRLNYDELMKEREEQMRKYSFPHSVNGVDKRSKLSLQEFRDVYDGKWPVVVTDAMSSWAAMNWSGEYFFENYGNERVTMKTVNLDLDLVLSKVMPGLLDLHDLRSDDLDLLSQGNLDGAVSLALPLGLFYKNSHISSEHTWAYVEDELFIPMRPSLRDEIGDCDYLKEDFFSLWPEEVRPWNAMLLWGTSFSRSSLHIDPYNWTGTNAVIKGKKIWKLYPPGQDHLLYVKLNQLSGFPLDTLKYNSPIDAFHPDTERFPLFSQAHALDLEQLPGELLFIPTGWFHQAFNAEETIAVSSQVMNSNNWRVVLEEVLKIGRNLQRNKIGPEFDSLSPVEQVEKLMSMLPKHILERGRAVTQDVLNQIQHGYEGSRGMIP